MFGTASGGPLQQRKAVGGDESLDTANKALQHDALSKLHTQAGAENTMVDVLGDETVDLIKNPPPVPENTPERDKKNKAVAKQAKKAKKRTFQIMASTGPYGTVFVDGAEDLGTIEVMQGEPQTFDFIPDEGCKLANVVVDNLPMGPIQSYSFAAVAAAHSVYAIFEPAKAKPEVEVRPEPKSAPTKPQPKPQKAPPPRPTAKPTFAAPTTAPAVQVPRSSGRNYHRHKLAHAHKHAPLEHIHRHYHYHQDQRVLNLTAGGGAAEQLHVANAPEDEPPQPLGRPQLPPREPLQFIADPPAPSARSHTMSGMLDKLSDGTSSHGHLRLKRRFFALRPEDATLGFSGSSGGSPDRYFVDLGSIRQVRYGWTVDVRGSGVDAADVDELGFEIDYDSIHGAPMRLLAPSSPERERWLRCMNWVLEQRWPEVPIQEEMHPHAEMLVYTRSRGEQEMRRVYPDNDAGVTMAGSRAQSGQSRSHSDTRPRTQSTAGSHVSSRSQSRSQSQSRSRSRSRSRARPSSRSRSRSRARPSSARMNEPESPRVRAPQWYQHTQDGIRRTHPASSFSTG